MDTQTELVFQNGDIRLGFHIGNYGTLYESFKNVIETPLRSYQISIAEDAPWKPPVQTPVDILMTRQLLKRYPGRYACVHASLMYNLAGTVKGKTDSKFSRSLQNTTNGLIGELDVAAGFGAGVVVHIGSAKDKEAGMFIISRTIEVALERETPYTKKLSKELQIPIKNERKIILENAAGEGDKIGSTLDEIAYIINGVDEKYHSQLKVCIDTAHIFGAGQYDFGSSDQVVKFYEDFDSKIGLEKLELFHLNDSRAAYGTKKDRHENLGMGYIFGTDRDEEENGDGLNGLRKLIDFSEENRIPLVGEPPSKDRNGDRAAGPVWDYNVIRQIASLEKEVFVCE
jgi:deoxyribonuclease IV